MATISYRSGRRVICFGILGASIVLSGCSSYGPARMQADRFDYNQAIATSRKTQALLNIVRLRYSDWPMFLDVEQVVSQYSFEQTGTARGIFRLSDYDQLEAGWIGKYSERPVVMYKPLKGEKYMRAMLTPLPPAAMLGLVYSGWPADKMFKVMVHSVNGHRNTQVEGGLQLQPDLSFARFVNVLRAYQQRDALDIRVVPEDKDNRKVKAHIGFRTELVDKALNDDLELVRKLLKLDPTTDSYTIVWGSVTPDSRTIAIETRSVLQVMVELAATVEVPQEDIEEGRVAKLRPRPKENLSGIGPLLEVRSGDVAPEDAYVSCKYRGMSFWIDDTSLVSKETFVYLTLLLTLGDTASSSGAQMVITTN